MGIGGWGAVGGYAHLNCLTIGGRCKMDSWVVLGGVSCIVFVVCRGCCPTLSSREQSESGEKLDASISRSCVVMSPVSGDTSW